MTEFTINELKKIFDYNEAKRIAAKLSRYRLAKRVSQKYVPYKDGERLGSFSVFDINGCIQFYKNKMSLPNRNNVMVSMGATLVQLNRIKDALNE